MADHQETRRKLIHMLGGLGPPVSVLLFGWSGSVGILLFLLTFVVIGGILNLHGIRLPLIAALIHNTQRATERFPVTAVEFLLSVLVIGSLVAEVWFFPAIALLAFGDGAAGLVGTYIGRHKLPWNRRKSWEGLIAGAMIGALGVVLLTTVGHQQTWKGVLLAGPDWIAPAVFIVVAFAAIIYGTAFVVRVRGGVSVANAPGKVTLMAAAAGLLLAAVPLALVATGILHDRAILDEHVPVVLHVPEFLPYGALAAALAMLLETVLRRHDNVVLPFAYLALVLAFAQWDPLGLRAASARSFLVEVS